ncbi:MAG TPA: hypothetical protein PLJ27_12965 [Polyangiaceae bacterium]|jgi:hypothetical protein|nr:hypothetical protein [Polyangiaceae bacterium]HNZ21311.1 hypothetical protein [Polyangiaceae bacterium]HOD21004.1 hypothetical protein [Polyangiaceae bacterium]HOE47514.1 hypothetical protein [Polyangiaceae bacterium]HOG99491.1 hypothetical protein [Polyangiaceae bacterium]
MNRSLNSKPAPRKLENDTATVFSFPNLPIMVRVPRWRASVSPRVLQQIRVRGGSDPSPRGKKIRLGTDGWSRAMPRAWIPFRWMVWNMQVNQVL